MPNLILSMAGMAEGACYIHIMLIWMSLIGSFLFALYSLSTKGKIALSLSLLIYLFCLILFPWQLPFVSEPLGPEIDNDGFRNPDIASWNHRFHVAGYAFYIISIVYVPVIIRATKQTLLGPNTAPEHTDNSNENSQHPDDG